MASSSFVISSLLVLIALCGTAKAVQTCAWKTAQSAACLKLLGTAEMKNAEPSDQSLVVDLAKFAVDQANACKEASESSVEYESVTSCRYASLFLLSLFTDNSVYYEIKITASDRYFVAVVQLLGNVKTLLSWELDF